MSRPSFLADHNLQDAIVEQVLDREPTAVFLRAREVGLAQVPDAELLAFAAARGLIVVSHDVQTLIAAAYARVRQRQPMPGLFIVKMHAAVGPAIEEIVLRWAASDAEEWADTVEYLR